MYKKLRIAQIAAVAIPVLGLVIATIVAWPHILETGVLPWWWQIAAGVVLIGGSISLAIQCWIFRSGDFLLLTAVLAFLAGTIIYGGVGRGPLATHMLVIMVGYLLIMAVIVVGAMLLAMKRPVPIPERNDGGRKQLKVRPTTNDA